jgi:ubiquinone/menaquinone biosynthesis C-methylase UbiE
MKKEFIYTMLKNYGKYTKDDMNRLVSDTDKITIQNLSKEQLKYGIVKNLYSEESNKKRAFKIYSYVKKYINIKVDSFLDFGGASCDIAFYLGNNFHSDKIICVDIDEWLDLKFKRRNDVLFYNDTKKIEDSSIDLLLVSHTLHHINDIDIKEILKEFDRVLTKKGIIILQEHDCKNKEFAKLLDLQHIIFDTVISQISSYDNFIQKFYSNYKSIEEWNNYFNNFNLVKIIKKNSYDNSYYAIYKKKVSGTLSQSMENNYPYTNKFYNLDDIKNMYKNLEKYDYKKRLLYDKYYTVKKLKYNKYKYLFIGRPLLLLSEESDYENYNKIVDYFQNKEKMKCKRIGRKYSPIEFFLKEKKYIEEEALKKYGKITSFSIKEVIYDLNYECSNFRQVNLITIIQMFNPKSVLDFSSGWGERLLSCIFCNIEYTGVDPNINLFEGYNKMIELFAKDKSKYTLINDCFEDVKLDKTYDMIFTSPPYFDIETYTNNNTLSLSKYKTEKEWTELFLKKSLKKAYEHLNMGGYMCININQKDKKENYIQEMLDYVYTFPNMYFYGVIGYSDKNIKNPQPIWIWRKSEKTPNELYNPDIIITPIQYENKYFHIVRDDYLIGGTKQRGLVPLLENTNKKIFIYGGPVYGYAQIALAYAASITHKKLVVFVEQRNKLFPLTEYAKSFGATIEEVPQPAYLDKVLLYSKNYYEEDTKNRFLIKFGADDKIFIDYMISNISKAWGNKKHPERLWLVSGSAILLNILYKVFPTTFFNVVQVGKTIWDDQLETKRTKLYISSEKFQNIAKEQPPYPTVSTYDAKLWNFVKQDGLNDDYIWNVGKDI